MRWDGRVEAKDDAGKAVVLMTGGAIFNDPRMADPVFERLCSRIAQINMIGRRKMFIGVGSVFIVLPVLFFFWSGSISVPVISGAFIVLLSGVCVGLGILSGGSGVSFSGQLISTMLAGGVCPSCTYSLIGIELSDGQLVDCPECGASWEARRITSARHYRTAPRQGESKGQLRKALRTPHVKSLMDERGVRFPLVSRKLRLEIATASDDRRKDQLTEIRKTIAPLGRWHRGVAAVLTLLFPFGLGFMPSVLMALSRPAGSPAFTPSSPIFFAGTLAFMPMFAVFAVSTFRGEWGVHPSRVRRVMAIHELCPSCACDLHGIGAEQDGCTVCPECGAAWKLPCASEAPVSEGTGVNQ